MDLPISTLGYGIPQLQLENKVAERLQTAAISGSPENDVAQKRRIPPLPGVSDGKSGPVRPAPMEFELPFLRKLEYFVDSESHQVLVKVIDPDTDKVIRILPPEEIQMLNRHNEDISGFLIDQEA